MFCSVLSSGHLMLTSPAYFCDHLQVRKNRRKTEGWHLPHRGLETELIHPHGVLQVQAQTARVSLSLTTPPTMFQTSALSFHKHEVPERLTTEPPWSTL